MKVILSSHVRASFQSTLGTMSQMSQSVGLQMGRLVGHIFHHGPNVEFPLPTALLAPMHLFRLVTRTIPTKCP